MLVVLPMDVVVVVVVEERNNITTCNVGIVLIFTCKITCRSSHVKLTLQ